MAAVVSDDAVHLRPCFRCGSGVLDGYGHAIIALQPTPGSGALYRVPMCDVCAKRIASEYREERIL